MLRIIYAILCAMTATVAVAQPIITAATFTPQVGDNFVISNCSTIQPGNSGAGVTWDFNNIVIYPSTNTTSYLAPELSGSTDSFANCNLMVTTGFPGVFGYLRTNDDSVTIRGLRQSGGIGQLMFAGTAYNLIKYPFHLGDSFKDSVVWQLCDTESRIMQITYDGYGTLLLAGETYPNVTRIKTTIIDTTSNHCTTAPFETPIAKYYDTLYDYYIAGYHWPLVKIDCHGSMHPDAYLSIPDKLQVSAISTKRELKIYPNPASDHINISFALENAGTCTISIMEMAGQTLWRQTETDGKAGSNIYEIATDKLPAGIYTVVLNTGKENYYTRLPVAH